MDHELYEAVVTGDMATIHEFASRDAASFLQLTTEGDNVLHVTAKYNLKRMTAEIIRIPPLISLVNQKNSKGDTPLHVAARLGSFETAEIFVSCANSGEMETGERVIKMVNGVHDTALHEAARNGHLRIVELLIREDPELPTLVNGAGESPLFIAVDKKHLKVAEFILKDAQVFSFAGRNNMNALHAAVIRSQDEVLRLSSYMTKIRSPMTYLTNMSFKHSFKISSFGPSAIIQAAFQTYFYTEFAILLLEKCLTALSEADELGWTPLHYAIHFGAVDIFRVFLEHVDSSVAHKRDKQGMSIIHIAAREGEAGILEGLAYAFPESWDLQDSKGQTAFHLAVERGKLACVKFILRTDRSHLGFINHQDNQGNTALHLATIHGNNQQIFELLIKDARVDKTATNTEGLTVIDILMLKEFGYFEKTWVTMNLASTGGLQSLEHAINKNGRKTRPTESTTNQQQAETGSDAGTIGAQSNKNPEPIAFRKPSSEQLQNIASINLLVTTLIATVSFAAGFTMPGGYKSDGIEQGMAILSRNSAFRVFVIANALAFCFSATSMFLHYCKSFVEKLDVHAFYTYLTTLLTSYAITAMVIAFVSGTYAVLADTPGLAKAVLSIGCSFFGLQLLVYLK
ncbi:hypothetical protein like AT1G03670 [Hibiscus trionum]|uniref:PGG domain-containing protein n=1 Tax=Hibiscus trionum TaxID=183268 RepID=A0A9W7IDE4_HIBTR|nr:hypothetical protein like AT1G03670 [Hibiscus trionum]